MLEKSKIREKVGNLIIFTYLLLTVVFYRFGFGSKIDTFLVITINALGFFGILLFWKRLFRTDILFFCFIMLASSVLSYLLTRNSSIINYLTTLRFLGLVFIMLSTMLNKSWLGIIMIFTLLQFTPVFYHSIGYNVFVRTSQNYHSVVLMLVNFIFNLSYWQENTKAPLIATFIPLAISFLSGGRGPILSYTLFFFGCALINYRKDAVPVKMRAKNYLSIILAISVLFLAMNIYANHKNLSFLVFPIDAIIIPRGNEILITSKDVPEASERKNSNNETRVVATQSRENEDMLFESGFRSNARVNIMKAYYKGMFRHPKYFFFGFPLKASKYIMRFNGNPHNSLIRLHANYGLFGLLTVSIMLLGALWTLIREREIGWIILMAGVILRGMTDIVAFPGNLDIIVYYTMFQFAHKKKRSIVNNS
jgi:hypothetical protein